MKRVVYKGFGKGAERIKVETSGYKDPDGKAVWVGEDGMTYELSYAKWSGKWGATPMMSLQEGIKQGLYKAD